MFAEVICDAVAGANEEGGGAVLADTSSLSSSKCSLLSP